MTSLAAAQYLRLRRQCDANPPGLRIRLLRALAVIRPEISHD
jgi:hypothetical protein